MRGHGNWAPAAMGVGLGGLIILGLVGCTHVAGPAQPQSAPEPAVVRPRPKKTVRHGPTASNNPAPKRYARYKVIQERDIFQPLVESEAEAEPPESFPSPTQPRTQADEQAQKGPTDDLALTGVVEGPDGLQALIENIETGAGQYLSIGEEVEGLKLVGIALDRVTLVGQGQTYELVKGAKEIQEEAAAQPTAVEKPKAEPKPQVPKGALDLSKVPRGLGSSKLREMYNRYKHLLTPEQRQQAEEYIQQREREEGG